MDHHLQRFKGHGVIGKLIDWKRLESILDNYHITLLDILGKGHRGVVFKGIYKGKNVAIKVPRVDAKNNLYEEGRILKYANTLNIGPKVYIFSEDYLVMEYIEGITLKEYISSEEIDREEYLNIVEEVLKQCIRLDIHGIDHGEIQGGKHIIISSKIYIIDFSCAKIGRTPRNFTSAVSLFFGKSYIARRTCEILGITEEEIEKIREVTRKYKEYIIKNRK